MKSPQPCKRLVPALLLLATVLLGTCTKKPADNPGPSAPVTPVVDPIDTPCQPLQLVEHVIPLPSTSAKLGFNLPCANPTNAQELIYWRIDASTTPTQTGLYKVNLQTRQQQLVLQPPTLDAQLSWSTTGWLALSYGGQVYKVKTNGDSLTQASFGHYHDYPCWSPDGQRLVCRQTHSQRPARDGIVLLDKDGEVLPTAFPLPNRTPYGWSSDGQKLVLDFGYDADYGLAVYDFATGQTTKVAASPIDVDAAGLIYSAAWVPNTQTVIWSTGRGIFSTDVATQQTTCLHSGCDSRLYLGLTVTADARHILTGRADSKAIQSGQAIYGEQNIWIMDLDGRNETKQAL